MVLPRRSLLRQVRDGLLGADLIGFHVRAHCINFLNTVDHALEAPPRCALTRK